ncbi:unnamed protein product [Gongylonema pulchrum]|uniref:Uncharacterized protein n=1 Tax=Gongylonema pulchrum TaxID=637853 RepID=A0A183EEW9_9BILA|nr:unnamed protein product [Gongylonema pulchrum]
MAVTAAAKVTCVSTFNSAVEEQQLFSPKILVVDTHGMMATNASPSTIAYGTAETSFTDHPIAAKLHNELQGSAETNQTVVKEQPLPIRPSLEANKPKVFSEGPKTKTDEEKQKNAEASNCCVEFGNCCVSMLTSC